MQQKKPGDGRRASHGVRGVQKGTGGNQKGNFCAKHIKERCRAGVEDIGQESVICRMDDKLPSATEEMEKRAAEYDALMEHSVG